MLPGFRAASPGGGGRHLGTVRPMAILCSRLVRALAAALAGSFVGGAAVPPVPAPFPVPAAAHAPAPPIVPGWRPAGRRALALSLAGPCPTRLRHLGRPPAACGGEHRRHHNSIRAAGPQRAGRHPFPKTFLRFHARVTPGRGTGAAWDTKPRVRLRHRSRRADRDQPPRRRRRHEHQSDAPGRHRAGGPGGRARPAPAISRCFGSRPGIRCRRCAGAIPPTRVWATG